MRSTAAVVVAGTMIVSPALAQQKPIEEPETGGFFRVQPATGKLSPPLESIDTKVKYAGRTYWCYLPGPESTVEFPTNEPHAFAVRILGPPSLEEQRKKPTYKLEVLAVKEGKRYGTKQFIPVDITMYGTVKYGLDWNKKRNSGALTFLYTPREPLAPGEYAFSIGGLITAYAGFGASSNHADAFRIVPGAAPVARAAPPQAAPAAPPATAPAQPQTPQAPQAPTAVVDLRQLRAAAERGDRDSQFNLGYAYVMGNGVLQDYGAALEWFQKASARGSTQADYCLGVMYRDAMGVAQDDVQAARLFKKAAEQGLPAAQWSLGSLYFLGKGVSPDYVEAHKWLNLAASRLTGEDQKAAAAERQRAATMMMPEQVSEAQKRAREWLEAFEKRRP